MNILNAVLMASMLAIIVEALVEYGSTISAMIERKEHKKAIKQMCAIGLGITFCLAAGVDFFSEIGIMFQIPFLGIILTGIFISRGANYVSDLIKRLQTISGVGTVIHDKYLPDFLSNPQNQAAEEDELLPY